MRKMTTKEQKFYFLLGANQHLEALSINKEFAHMLESWLSSTMAQEELTLRNQVSTLRRKVLEIAAMNKGMHYAYLDCFNCLAVRQKKHGMQVKCNLYSKKMVSKMVNPLRRAKITIPELYGIFAYQCMIREAKSNEDITIALRDCLKHYKIAQ